MARPSSWGGRFGALVLWDVEARKVKEERTGGMRDVRAVAVSADGKWMAAAGRGGLDVHAVVWDAKTAKVRGPITIEKSPRMANVIALSPDGSILAISGQGVPTVLWDVANERPLVRLNKEG